MYIRFDGAGFPPYHAGALLVRMRPGAQVPAAVLPAAAPAMFTALGFAPLGLYPAPSASGGGVAAAVAPTQGLAALAFMQRAGLLKRIIPLSRSAAASPDAAMPDPQKGSLPAGAQAVTALLSTRLEAPPQGGTPDPLGGGSLIQLDREEDAAQLRLALAADPHVASVSRVPLRHLAARSGRAGVARDAPPAGVAAVPPAEPLLWNLRRIAWAEARNQDGFQDAGRIKVAVLDTGIDASHPDLDGLVAGYTHAHPDLPGASSPRDIVGHGTHVAGIIAAATNNGLGINGICRCALHVWKIFDDDPVFLDGIGFQYVVNPVMYLRALADCIEQGMDVVNLSIGGAGLPGPDELEAFAGLVARDTAVVAAMGNERQFGSPVSYPAAIPGVIAVGATGLDDRVTLFSNAGNHITVAAPGLAIWSTLPRQPGQTGFHAVIGPDGKPQQGKPMRRETDYDAWPGTSMAAPHVAAAVALHRASFGPQPVGALRQALAQSADRVPSMNGAPWHSDYGFGRLNLRRLLQEPGAASTR